jgi:hypothetical protein
MGRRMAMLGGALVIVVILLVFVLAGCAGGEEEGKDGPVPSSLQEADNVVVRVSGAQDTAYIGHYGTLGGSRRLSRTL